MSRAMVLAPDFFYWMHGDVAHLSKHRNYGNGSTKMILLLIDSLSLMTFFLHQWVLTRVSELTVNRNSLYRSCQANRPPDYQVVKTNSIFRLCFS